jgi:hypothetical protein
VYTERFVAGYSDDVVIFAFELAYKSTTYEESILLVRQALYTN